jgi:hypothetical protein
MNEHYPMMLKSTVFWDIPTCSLERVRRFRGTYRFRLQDWIVCQAELASCFCCLLTCSTRPWRWSCYASIRRAVSKLHGATTHETVSFIVTAAATVNRINWIKLDSRMLLSSGYSVVGMFRYCIAGGISGKTNKTWNCSEVKWRLSVVFCTKSDHIVSVVMKGVCDNLRNDVFRFTWRELMDNRTGI